MSELKKKILEGIRTNGMQEWAFMINDYDGIMDYEKLADEDIDELATAILNEIANQPQLNEYQQIAINNAKKSFEKGSDLYDCAIDMMLYDGLTDKEWAKVTVAFLLWALEQEEE